MIIDSIQNGIVIDHISAGKAMELYNILGLDKLDCTVAILKNVTSGKLGRKDIIKIDREMELDWDLIGYVDPTITVNIIHEGQLIEKRRLKLPERIRGVLKCKNPRCITSVEQELPQEFVLTDRPSTCTAASTARPRPVNKAAQGESYDEKRLFDFTGWPRV